MLIGDWSSGVCSSDLSSVNSLACKVRCLATLALFSRAAFSDFVSFGSSGFPPLSLSHLRVRSISSSMRYLIVGTLMLSFLASSHRNLESVIIWDKDASQIGRAHVELQSLMRISYAVFCLKKKRYPKQQRIAFNINHHTRVTARILV